MRLIGELGGYLNQAVMVAAIVIAVVRMRRDPRKSRLVAIAFALPLLVTLVLPINLGPVEQWIAHLSESQRELVLCLSSALWKTARAAAYVLLLVACFSSRRAVQQVADRDDGPEDGNPT